MNKLTQDKNVYLQARKHPVYSKEIAMTNAYASFGRISKEFNVPLVNKTFGKGIVRVSCQTIMELDNIPLIIKELVKYRLIEEIGMQPLAYSNKMNSLVLFFKPTGDTSSQKLNEVFQKYYLTSFKYSHLVIDVDYPVIIKGGFQSKRIAVKTAHVSLLKTLKEFNIPCVNQTFGLRIVRVCCRSVVQLDNIAFILKELLKYHLIEEVRMPLEYCYKMRSLVLFLKSVDLESHTIVERVFQKCLFKYHYNLIEIKYPEAAAEKEDFEEEPILSTNINLIQPDEQDANDIPMDTVLKVVILVAIISILLTSVFYKM